MNARLPSRVYWLQTSDPATDTAVEFAATEFARYAARLTGSGWATQGSATVQASPGEVWVGLCDRLPQPPGADLAPSPLDDGYVIWPLDGALLIAGRNARSVLFGVYAYLEGQGVRFLRPGPDGEIVPHPGQLTWPPTPVVEEAYYRHRGVCIEGATSLEHALGMVDWCAKRRMNTLFLQFFSSKYFYELWYSRPYNEQFADHHVTDAEAAVIDQEVIAGLKQRGMICHRVGHGWTATTLGMPRSGWVRTDEPMPEGRVRWAAQVNGVRELHDHTPINTELCYSYRPAFDALVENVVRYSTAHPKVDVVHVWLSDATNNKCECEECRQLSISDWYARLINAIAAELHRRAPGKRFVFLCYFELLWPPEQTEIDADYQNMIMMYAPIYRCYGHGLFNPECDDGVAYPRPELNHYVRPTSNAFFARTLADWRGAFDGDSFCFDYHLMWANWRQLTDTVVAQVLHQDLQSFRAHGMNGVISCQPFRNFYPSGLAMAVLADGLWNPDVSWENLRQRHLIDSFGASASFVGAYLDQLEGFLDSGDPHWRTNAFAQADRARLTQFVAFLDGALPELAAWQERLHEPAHTGSMNALIHHAKLAKLICAAYITAIDKGPDEGVKALEKAEDFLRQTEPDMHYVMDAMLMLRTTLAPMAKAMQSR